MRERESGSFRMSEGGLGCNMKHEPAGGSGASGRGFLVVGEM